jgi:hypothetical protein
VAWCDEKGHVSQYKKRALVHSLGAGSVHLEISLVMRSALRSRVENPLFWHYGPLDRLHQKKIPSEMKNMSPAFDDLKNTVIHRKKNLHFFPENGDIPPFVFLRKNSNFFKD